MSMLRLLIAGPRGTGGGWSNYACFRATTCVPTTTLFSNNRTPVYIPATRVDELPTVLHRSCLGGGEGGATMQALLATESGRFSKRVAFFV